jgi:hypothetical protein
VASGEVHGVDLSDMEGAVGWMGGSRAFFGLAELLGRRWEASPVGRLRLQACPTGGELEIEDRELEVEDDLHVSPMCK